MRRVHLFNYNRVLLNYTGSFKIFFSKDNKLVIEKPQMRCHHTPLTPEERRQYDRENPIRGDSRIAG